jgi:hypothetical protein
MFIGHYCYHKLAHHSNSFYEILAIEQLTGNTNSLSNLLSISHFIHSQSLEINLKFSVNNEKLDSFLSKYNPYLKIVIDQQQEINVEFIDNNEACSNEKLENPKSLVEFSSIVYGINATNIGQYSVYLDRKNRLDSEIFVS